MKTKIGGQAVIEGVMMRGASSMALSVRDEMGQIRVETTRLPLKKPWYRKVPFLRGVVNLFISMVDGFKIIGKSAEVMVEEVDASEKDNSMGGVLAFSMLLGICLALILFVFVPTALTSLIFKLFGLDSGEVSLAWLKSLLEGVFKLAVLIGYMGGISAMPQIRRVFMYHGAEHKTIACFEAEMPLTVENVKKCSRYHDRCGTSFIVFVVVLSVVLMMVLDVVCAACNFTAFLETWWLRVLLKIALLPVTAGFSYEMLMLLARSNFVLFRPLKWLGKQFQKLTTREPDESMCEVAICSFNKVLEMDADPTIPEVRFPEPMTLAEFREKVEASGIADYASKVDDWLVAAVLQVKEEDLVKNFKVPFGWGVRVDHMVREMSEGKPWQQAIGATQFFGRNFWLDENVLIPRPETELVTEWAIEAAKKAREIHKGAVRVLDLCCGSGAIGLTTALECAKSGASVKLTCADIDKKALNVCRCNAKNLKVRTKLIKSDMFSKIGGKFDVIVCNPPYIATSEIEKLDSSVKDFEPRLALDGGVDGLKFYRILAEQAPEHLAKGSTLVCEIGYDQGRSAKEIFAAKFDVEVLKDYSQNDRILVAKLR